MQDSLQFISNPLYMSVDRGQSDITHRSPGSRRPVIYYWASAHKSYHLWLQAIYRYERIQPHGYQNQTHISTITLIKVDKIMHII